MIRAHGRAHFICPTPRETAAVDDEAESLKEDTTTMTNAGRTRREDAIKDSSKH
jgi:hypothetical protein